MTKPTKESAIDEYLAAIGLWRKPIAKDGSCIFRAVSERVSCPFFRSEISMQK